MQRLTDQELFQSIHHLIHKARVKVGYAINNVMVNTYYEIGKLIVEHEQKGMHTAHYGGKVLKGISLKLTNEFGKGFSVDNLENMRRFYLTFPISETVSRIFKLSWSHYVFLIRLPKQERQFYENEAAQNNWSLRELKRQFHSALYERQKIGKKKGLLHHNSQTNSTATTEQMPVKDPYILEFLGLKEETRYSESELEQAIIDKLEQFMLELGKGFTFVGRQQRISISESHFYVDLVFYNRLLRCFVLIDLKIGNLKHQDLGQIQMYVNYYDRFIKTDDENPTIGIVLCKDKNDGMVEITLPQDNQHIFASRYQAYLPTKSQLLEQLEEAEESIESD